MPVMKVTIEIPDDLYRMVKARSALEGRSVRAAAIELFKRWLKETPGTEKTFLSAYDLMKDVIGSIETEEADLSTNPKHMEGFGEDSLGRR
jgi:hypothetical protein